MLPISNNDGLGLITTVTALLMNVMISQEINQLLTIVVSLLSIAYLLMKLDEKNYHRKERKKLEAKIENEKLIEDVKQEEPKKE